MNLCNFCKFKSIKSKAALVDNKAIASKRMADFGLGGVRVYIVPKRVSIRTLSDDELKKYDSGTWFMSLSKKCEC